MTKCLEKPLGSWGTKHDGQNFLSFWTIFHPFTPLTTWKITILIKWEKAWIYYHFPHVYHKGQLYDVWFLRYETWQTNFLSFWTVFCPLTPLTAQKIKILKNWKKTWRYYHFTQEYHKSWLYAILFLRYGEWQVFFFFSPFWAIFCPFTLPNSPKNQNFKKMKKIPGDIIFQWCNKNHDHMLYCSWDVFFHFGPFFALLSPHPYPTP